MTKTIHHLHWQGIDIEVSYTPKWGSGYSRLEIRSIAPERAQLPVTATGYRSHFIRTGLLESSNLSVCGWVRNELDRAATRAWQEHLAREAQGELF